MLFRSFIKNYIEHYLSDLKKKSLGVLNRHNSITNIYIHCLHWRKSWFKCYTDENDFTSTSVFICFAFILYYFKCFNIIGIPSSDCVLIGWSVYLSHANNQYNWKVQCVLQKTCSLVTPEYINSKPYVFGLVPYRIYPISSRWPQALCCHLHLRFSTRLHFQFKIPAESTHYPHTPMSSGCWPVSRTKV